jgi:hypothetical protein
MRFRRIFVLFLVLTFLLPSVLTARPTSATSAITYTVQPVAIAPLLDKDLNPYVLETGQYYWPYPVGQFFDVQIHLVGATVGNLVAGVGAVEVHLNLSEVTSPYVNITGFTDMLGQPDGVLVGPQNSLLYDKQAGFYDNEDNFATFSGDLPFPNATQYIVSANSTNGPWNATDGLVAIIHCRIIGMPNTFISQPDFIAFIPITFRTVVGGNGDQASVDVVQGTLHIDAATLGPPSQGVFVTPPLFTGAASLGSSFNFSVWANIGPFWDVAGFDITMSWNNTLINLVNVFEGGYLKEGGAATMGWSNATEGSVEVNYTKLTDPIPSYAIDSLFIMEFNVTYISDVYPTPNCTISQDSTNILLEPHPERPYAPWLGSNSTVLMPHDFFALNYIANATYLSPGLPWHDIGIINMGSRTTFGTGYILDISVEGINDGNFTESFNLTVCVNSVPLGVHQISLNASEQATDVFGWNTTGLAYGNYNLTTYAQPVQNETYASNNNFTVVVQVTIPGDISGDFQVSLADLVLLANAYGSRLGDVKWSPNADVNGDGKVSLADLVILANHYGQHYP